MKVRLANVLLGCALLAFAGVVAGAVWVYDQTKGAS